MNARGQQLQLGRAADDLAGDLGHVGACHVWQGPTQVADEPIVEDGAEQGGAESASHRPEEGSERRRRPEVLVIDSVLDGEDQHLHHQTQSEPGEQHESGGHKE